MAKNNFDSSVNDLIHAVGLLVRRIRTVGPQELSLSEASVLKRLNQDGPATTADLARLENMRPQSMGEVVAGLEGEGLVGRRQHPTDGRQMLIHVSPKGAKLLEDRKAAKRTWLGEEIARLDKEEQTALFQAAEILKRIAGQ